MSADAAPASRPDICLAFAAGAVTSRTASNARARAFIRRMAFQRLARTVLPLLVALCALAGAATASAKSSANVQAGAAILDGTYHVGNSAGQYASTRDGGYGDVDPHLQQVKNQASYGVQSREN